MRRTAAADDERKYCWPLQVRACHGGAQCRCRWRSQPLHLLPHMPHLDQDLATQLRAVLALPCHCVSRVLRLVDGTVGDMHSRSKLDLPTLQSHLPLQALPPSTRQRQAWLLSDTNRWPSRLGFEHHADRCARRRQYGQQATTTTVDSGRDRTPLFSRAIGLRLARCASCKYVAA